MCVVCESENVCVALTSAFACFEKFADEVFEIRIHNRIGKKQTDTKNPDKKVLLKLQLMSGNVNRGVFLTRCML